MKLNVGLILPFLLLVTADNNVRKQRTPGEVDGGYLTEAMYTQYRKADDWIPEPSFIDRAIPFFDIPGTKDAVLVVRCVLFLVLVGGAFTTSFVFAILNSTSNKNGNGPNMKGFCITSAVLSGVVLIVVFVYILAVLVYFKRRG
ncbi:hypothetical protein BgAZ_300030 [Babesia gibsoni]|uniref:Transmembrane protein n=1 Tax=Babesia gibsoni TaxID=33632 RepID=A0AAD8P8E4_BABGI|nr:hypothetical protein BgAZ_300030 [Babesia gibsoni]